MKNRMIEIVNYAVSDVIKETWNLTRAEIVTIANDVVFPALSLILAIVFFVKLGGAYFDYRKHGMIEWTAPTIIFVCLVFTLLAPQFIWSIV